VDDLANRRALSYSCIASVYSLLVPRYSAFFISISALSALLATGTDSSSFFSCSILSAISAGFIGVVMLLSHSSRDGGLSGEGRGADFSEEIIHF
jgi:hypothetical protein